MRQKTPVVCPEQVLTEVAKHAGVTTREVAQSLVVSYSTAKRYLTRLTERGYLTATKTHIITYTVTEEGQQAWEEGRS